MSVMKQLKKRRVSYEMREPLVNLQRVLQQYSFHSVLRAHRACLY